MINKEGPLHIAQNFSRKLVLASGSPRRRELLSSLGLVFDIVPPDISEDLDLNNGPGEAVRLVAVAKGEEVAKSHELSVVLSADTIVVLEDCSQNQVVKGTEFFNQQAKLQCSVQSPSSENSSFVVLGKPRDKDDAREMLHLLSGREHQVITGYSIQIAAASYCISKVITTTVRFRRLREDHIDLYLSQNEWSDKAGAYAIQGIGAGLIDSIYGSYTNVIGLPLNEVFTDLLGAFSYGVSAS